MSATPPPTLLERLNKLGLRCESVPTDRLSSATTALACIPMYMVANVHAWTSDRQFRIPVLDLPGSEQMRESFEIGQQEASLEISEPHRKALGTLLRSERPADRIIYEYALEALADFLATAVPDVAATTRAAVARMIVGVAKAAGKGPLGSGRKVSAEERECIAQISQTLGLAQEPAAAAALATLDQE